MLMWGCTVQVPCCAGRGRAVDVSGLCGHGPLDVFAYGASPRYGLEQRSGSPGQVGYPQRRRTLAAPHRHGHLSLDHGRQGLDSRVGAAPLFPVLIHRHPLFVHCIIIFILVSGLEFKVIIFH